MFFILHHDRLNMIDVHTFENKTAAYYTLGCKLNFAETSTLGKILEENGIRKIRPGEKADICVVNTCSVTELADKKCRQTIRKIARQHPGAFIVVTGCYAQLKPEEISHIPDVDLILGAEQKLDILQYLGDLQKKQKGKTLGEKPLCLCEVKCKPRGGCRETGWRRARGHVQMLCRGSGADNRAERGCGP